MEDIIYRHRHTLSEGLIGLCVADVNNEQICFSLPIIWLTRCTLGNILRMGIGFKRSVRPGYRNSKFYDAYDLIPVESESWVNLRRRDTDPIMYKPSGRLPERVWSGGRGSQLSNRQPAAFSTTLLRCLYPLFAVSVFCVWPGWKPLCHPVSRTRGGLQVWVSVTIIAIYSPLPTPSVSTVTNQATTRLLGTWKVVKTILWFINKSWMFKTQSTIKTIYSTIVIHFGNRQFSLSLKLNV